MEQFFLSRWVILAKGVTLFHWSAGGSDAPKFAAMAQQSLLLCDAMQVSNQLCKCFMMR